MRQLANKLNFDAQVVCSYCLFAHQAKSGFMYTWLEYEADKLINGRSVLSAVGQIITIGGTSSSACFNVSKGYYINGDRQAGQYQKKAGYLHTRRR